MDKVKFSVRNAHYAPFTDEAKGTYGTPVPMPGMVAISLDPQGETTVFHADGIVYFRADINNGYSGEIECAYFLPDFLKDIFQYTEGAASKVLTENANKTSKPFALLLEEEGDETGTKYAFFKCTATRPKKAFKTKTNTKDPTTQSMAIVIEPLADGDVFSMTQADTPKDTVDNWYKSVYRETAVSST